ncbi:MAG: alpha/beta hydrolase family protein [Alphaproteobacteria bacterium]|jgi:pimeloyl-ACP methyl ester carboxylesterase|nr:alpha/beta hydrolase family protein [Alphaproteobacteria bacterium]
MKILKWLGIGFAALLALIVAAAFAIGFRLDIPVDELKPRYATAPSRFVELDGLAVHYRDQGPRGAPALLLLHGSAASLHTWEGWARNLGGDFRVVSVDLPAHGLTGPWPNDGDYSLDAYARFVDRFADKIGLQRFALAGNSMGGTIAWTYAGRYPQRVEKLILLDAAGYPHLDAQRFFGLARLPGSEFLLRWFAPRFVVALTLRSVYADPAKVDDALIDRYRDLVLRAGNRAATMARLEAFKPDLALLAKLDMPVLVMWGGKDRIVLPADAFRFHNDIKNATLKIYSDLGHVPMEEDPERSANDVRKFLLGR